MKNIKERLVKFTCIGLLAVLMTDSTVPPHLLTAEQLMYIEQADSIASGIISGGEIDSWNSFIIAFITFLKTRPSAAEMGLLGLFAIVTVAVCICIVSCLKSEERNSAAAYIFLLVVIGTFYCVIFVSGVLVPATYFK